MSPRYCIWILAGALCTTAGCKRPKDDASEGDLAAAKVTPDSPYDATTAIVDDDYRIRLGWPGKGWKLLREEEARRIVPGSVLGALNPEFGQVFLTVTRAPGLGLEELADIHLSVLNVSNFELVARTQSRVLDRDAIRLDYNGERSGARFDYSVITLREQDYAFEFSAYARNGKQEEGLRRVLEHFEFSGGPISGRDVSNAPIASTQGVGWMVEDGVFTSAVSGLRIDPLPGWALVLENELVDQGVFAEVAIKRENPDAHIVFASGPAPSSGKPRFARALNQRFTEQFASDPLEPLEISVAGEPITFTRVHEEAFEHVHGVRFEGTTSIRMFGWFLAAMQARMHDSMQVGLGSVSLLSEGERQALRRRLWRSRSALDRVTEHASVRGDGFRDFRHHVSWKTPVGFWRLTPSPGEYDPEFYKDTVLRATELELGLELHLIVSQRPGITEDAWRTEVFDLWEETFEADKKRGRPAGQGERWGARAVGEYKDSGLDYVRRLAYGVRGDRGIVVSVSGPKSKMTLEADTVVDAMDALTVHDELPQNTSAPDFSDAKFGLTLQIPDGFTRERAQESDQELGLHRLWSRGEGDDEDVISVVVVPAPSTDSAWIAGLMEQLMVSKFEESGAKSVRRGTAQLDGRPFRRFSAKQGGLYRDGYAFAQRGIVYLVWTVGKTKDLGPQVANSFRFLE